MGDPVNFTDRGGQLREPDNYVRMGRSSESLWIYSSADILFSPTAGLGTSAVHEVMAEFAERDRVSTTELQYADGSSVTVHTDRNGNVVPSSTSAGGSSTWTEDPGGCVGQRCSTVGTLHETVGSDGGGSSSFQRGLESLWDEVIEPAMMMTPVTGVAGAASRAGTFTFKNLGKHALKHGGGLSRARYLAQALHNIATGTSFAFRHDGASRTAYITRIGADEFRFTSTGGEYVLTHFNVNSQYLRNIGITLPAGF